DPRDRILSDARRWLMTYRRHMRMEETVLFSAAEREMSAADWAGLGDRALMLTDPVHAQAAADRFAAVRERIRQLSGTGRGGVAMAS
ncbi:MAG: hypothetical protein R3F55_13650, partial [Alphaproteobacteria bacterium]